MTTASALSRLLRPVEPLPPSMSISEVADRLLTPDHKAFLSLPVVDADLRPSGLVSLVVTPFCDTQALLKLINEAQIFRYLPTPIRRGLFEKGLKAAAEQPPLPLAGEGWGEGLLILIWFLILIYPPLQEAERSRRVGG